MSNRAELLKAAEDMGLGPGAFTRGGKIDIPLLLALAGGTGLAGVGAYRAATQREEDKDRWDPVGIAAGLGSLPLLAYGTTRTLQNMDVRHPKAPVRPRTSREYEHRRNYQSLGLGDTREPVITLDGPKNKNN